MSTSASATRQQTLAPAGEHDKVSVVHAHRAAIASEDTHDERDHEVRAALFGIEAVAEGLRRNCAVLDPSHVDELTRAMVFEVRRVRALLDGRVGSPCTFDLSDAIGPIIACARASGMDVTSTVPVGIAVEGQRDSTAQVLRALLYNAHQHAPGSPVELRASVIGGVAVLHVEDRGAGIAGPLSERIFERGVSGADSTGSGLGLHIARRLMQEQGGSIAVCSRPGGGTSFMLRFRCPR